MRRLPEPRRFSLSLTVSGRGARAILHHTGKGLVRRTQVPHDVVNATAYFQGMMTSSSGVIGQCCPVYVDDVVVLASDPAELMTRLEVILERLMEVQLFAATRKAEVVSRAVC